MTRHAGQPSPGAEDLAPEVELDELLAMVEEKKARKSGPTVQQLEVIDLFRNRMRQVYAPLFEELRRKYEPKGVALELDAADLLGGGSTLRLRFTYEDLTLELDGTVMRGAVAFYLIRSVGSAQGAVVSGPMLCIRTLTAEDFRHFVLTHIRSLIKDALRRA
jgi:hypothetical protein